MAGAVPSGSRWGQPPTRSAPSSSASTSSDLRAGAGGARHRRFAQRHDLDVDDVRQQLARRQHALDRYQSACLGDVDMGANGRVSAARHHATGSDGTVRDVRDSGAGESGQHAVDGSGEIAGRVGYDIGEERLVEMGVRLDGRRQQHEPVEVDVGCLAGTPRAGRRDRGDRAVDDRHVASFAADESTAQHDLGHRTDSSHALPAAAADRAQWAVMLRLGEVSSWSARRLWWSLAAAFFVAIAAWSLGTPLMTGHDEAANAVRAAAVVRGDVFGEAVPGFFNSVLEVPVPEAFGRAGGCRRLLPRDP